VSRALRLIVNPSAGRGRARRALPGVERELAALGVPFRTDATTSLEHAAELARDAAAAGEVATAMGGDGLIGAVAGALRGTDGVLGVLPGGRGNDFARVLGVPRDPVEACRVLAHGEPRTIDLAEADGRVFIGIASVGFDSDANRIANEARLVRGDLVYVYGALRALAAWTPARFELELDGRRLEITGCSVAVANSKAYGGGMFVAPDAELDDGLLDVVIGAHVTRRRMLRQIPRVFKGTHVRDPEVLVERAREVRIAADRPFAIYADGDPVADLPATVRVLPGALNVLVSTSR
jgi:YegS/Rv2252/BmrU family lipid kinase